MTGPVMVAERQLDVSKLGSITTSRRVVQFISNVAAQLPLLSCVTASGKARCSRMVACMCCVSSGNHSYRWSHLALGDVLFADNIIGRLHMHAQSVRSVPSCVRLFL